MGIPTQKKEVAIYRMTHHGYPYSDCGKECTPLESLVTLQIHDILPWCKDKNYSLRCDL